jgi:hypothetical protein
MPTVATSNIISGPTLGRTLPKATATYGYCDQSLRSDFVGWTRQSRWLDSRRYPKITLPCVPVSLMTPHQTNGDSFDIFVCRDGVSSEGERGLIENNS